MATKHRRASQLAGLKQGSPTLEERPSRGPDGRRQTLGEEHGRNPDPRARNHTFRIIRNIILETMMVLSLQIGNAEKSYQLHSLYFVELTYYAYLHRVTPTPPK